MRKHAFVVLLALCFLMPMPFFSSQYSQEAFHNDADTDRVSLDKESIPSANDPTGVTNVAPNAGFEYEDQLGAPQDWDYYATGFQVANDSYQGLVHGGSYSGRMRAKGTRPIPSHANIYESMSPDNPYLNESLIAEFYSYVVQNPDMSLPEGSSAFVRFKFRNKTNYYLYYYLSTGSLQSNSSYEVYYDLNGSLSQWNHFNRNLTSDFEDAFGSISPNIQFNEVYFYATSPQNASGIIEWVIDDVAITNKTAYNYFASRNGDFETGPGSSWDTSGSDSAAYIGLTEDSVAGSYALNITVDSTVENSSGWGYSGLYPGSPYGLFATRENELVVSFDWRYDDTSNGGDTQYAYFNLRLANRTFDENIQFYLGRDLDRNLPDNETYPDHANIYLAAPGYGSRNEWQTFKLDVFEYMENRSLKSVGLSDVEFYVNQGSHLNSSAELLVDNFILAGYPLGDPGFEVPEGVTTEPIASWYTHTGDHRVNPTADARSGNYAANITLPASESCNLLRSARYHVPSSDLIDFWYRIDNYTSGTGAYGYFQISMEGNRRMYYYFALDSGLNPINSSNDVRFILDDVNVTGSWLNLRRNITDDALEYWNDMRINLTEFTIYLETDGSDFMSVIFDDMHFINTVAPEVWGITHSPSNPMYYEDVGVEFMASSLHAGIENVEAYYDSGSGWHFISVTEVLGVFNSTIPAQQWNTTVRYYVKVADFSGLETVLDNGGEYYEYTVGDDIDPAVSLDEPESGMVVSDIIGLAASASDTGSNIAKVEFLVSGQSVFNDTEAPYEYSLNTRMFDNGTHTVAGVAYDGAGRSTSDEVTIDIQNDVAPPELYGLQINPSEPEYGESVIVSVAALDATSVRNVTLYYQVIQSGSEISDEWIAEKMEVSGANYTATIPEAEYGEFVAYYIAAFDYFNQSASMGNATNPLSYEIADTGLPSFDVAGPPSDQPINGTVSFNITANDEGSGVASIMVSIDGEAVEEETDTTQFSFNWDTTTVENGDYIMTIEVTDGAGNTASVEIEYTVSNPVGTGGFLAGFAAFMAQYGLIVGAAIVFAIVGVSVFLIRRRSGS